MVSNMVDYREEIFFNKKYPDGTPRKIVSLKILNKMGWKHKINLKDGLELVYQHYKKI